MGTNSGHLSRAPEASRLILSLSALVWHGGWRAHGRVCAPLQAPRTPICAHTEHQARPTPQQGSHRWMASSREGAHRPRAIKRPRGWHARVGRMAGLGRCKILTGNRTALPILLLWPRHRPAGQAKAGKAAGRNGPCRGHRRRLGHGPQRPPQQAARRRRGAHLGVDFGRAAGETSRPRPTAVATSS